MRFAIVLLAAFGILAGSSALPAASTVVAASDDYIEAAAQQPSGQAEIDINVNRGGGAWWTSPTWIAIGVIALVLLIVVIAMATRGGGTTVIKE